MIENELSKVKVAAEPQQKDELSELVGSSKVKSSDEKPYDIDIKKYI